MLGDNEGRPTHSQQALQMRPSAGRALHRSRVFCRSSPLVLLAALGTLSAGCSSDGSDGTNGGTAGVAGHSGHTSAGSGGRGGSVAAGGASGSGGSAGLASGGTSGAAGHSGGGSGAGSGGAAAGVPSPGCGKAGRPAGGVVEVENHHIFTFPDSYDGRKPFPLLMGFHAAGNPIGQIRNLTNGSQFEDNYVRAFPKSAGTAWNYDVDIALVRSVFTELLNEHCIDTSRVFATGHSSGAQLIVQILNQRHTADAQLFDFKAVAPVAASDYGALSGAMPVMYIQGKMDTVRNSDGADVVELFTTANDCDSSSAPFDGAPECVSGGKTVNDGCIQYSGCSVPTVWCSHDDPQYGNTSHGWPCFATAAMYDFFTNLP